jgi:shikimate kinase
MAAILVTGMSGTGKSTALAELARRGFRVVDTDHDAFSVERWFTGEGRPEQLWREDRIDELLGRHGAIEPDEPLFVGGCVSNQGRFYPRFTAVVLLSAPVDVLLQRLAACTTNSFGKDNEERDRILADLAHRDGTMQVWRPSRHDVCASTTSRRSGSRSGRTQNSRAEGSSSPRSAS